MYTRFWRVFLFLGMQEDLLHFIWKTNKLPSQRLKTVHGAPVIIERLGWPNEGSGPDFFNAQLQIDGQLWAGNVEMHVKASDWHAHKHSQDAKYDNVILHVVWEHDAEVCRKDGTHIPTLSLKEYIPTPLLDAYTSLFQKRSNKAINCDAHIGEVPSMVWNSWLDRMFIERMEDKSRLVLELLQAYQNDWERVLFVLLFKNFGSKINGPLFLEMARQMDFAIVRKLTGQPFQMEALFMGMAGLLQKGPAEDTYFQSLQKEFRYLSQKFGLVPPLSPMPEFFKLRPANFPTIRLAQLASLYASGPNVFQKLLHGTLQELKKSFEVHLHPYWEDHYVFGSTSPKKQKHISANFVDLLVINTIFPLRFCYAKQQGAEPSEKALDLLLHLKAERNGVMETYAKLGAVPANAKECQALLHLYNNYCTPNKCLQCAVGASLLNLKS